MNQNSTLNVETTLNFLFTEFHVQKFTSNSKNFLYGKFFYKEEHNSGENVI